MNIQSLEFPLTPSIKDELGQLESSLSKFLSNMNDVTVVLSKENPTLFHVEISTNLLGNNVRSNHESHDFYKALHKSKDKFIKRILHIKNKHKTLKRQPEEK